MDPTDNELPDYEALSYTWGSTDDPVDIWLADLPTDADSMGEGHLAITQSLAVASRYLRSEESTRDIWIDAISGDQQNLGERGHQVERMGDIYQKAKRVLVGLGPESEDSALAIEKLLSISSWVEVDWNVGTITLPTHAVADKAWPEGPVDISYDEKTWSSILSLLCRPWLQRLWIWQEVLLAKTVGLQCGYDTLVWNDFRKAITALMSKGSQSYPSEYTQTRYEKAVRQNLRFVEYLTPSRYHGRSEA
ncbi:MAG: hypothetical protein L6R38_001246 [Xanthoria sp. 2 TBL-2021]|nr:MAG: hypothetical protein L6R38_001246 [Xanthoria sp. 2 TBL-2021]